MGVDFVPPAQAYEAAAGDVFEVVEVGREQEDGDDEDEDEICGEEHAEQVYEEGDWKVVCQWVWPVKNKGLGGVHILKERKVTSVMGWALRRQLSVPGLGFSMFALFWSIRRCH